MLRELFRIFFFISLKFPKKNKIKINSFLLTSKDHASSNYSLVKGFEDFEKVCKKQSIDFSESNQISGLCLKKTTIDFSDSNNLNLQNVDKNMSFEKLIFEEKRESLILETQREVCDSKENTLYPKSSFDTRVPNDLNLDFIVPKLFSIIFKEKNF